jgi:hypothetical protein
MRTISVSKAKDNCLFYVFSGGTMCFETYKAVKNKKSKLILDYFNVHLPKWSGVDTNCFFLK